MLHEDLAAGGVSVPDPNFFADVFYDGRREELRMAGGTVNAGGLPPPTFEQVASEAHRMGLVTGVAVRTFNRWQWAEAEFDIPGRGCVRRTIDALAVRYCGSAPTS